MAQTSPYWFKMRQGGYLPVGDGQCVAFIQSNGYGAYRGNAEDWKVYINSDVPVIGGVVVLNEGQFGHLALIIDITDEGIRAVEQNYQGVGIVSYRVLDFNYEGIIGFVIK